MAVTLEDVREFALPLPRRYERTIRDRVEVKVGQYVYLSVPPRSSAHSDRVIA